MNLLEVNRLSVAWAGQEAVHDVSCSLAAGEVLAIVGESGSGKSTLLKAILGLPSAERSITQGQILLGGRDLAALPASERRALCGPVISMIFQDAGASFCPVRRVGDAIWESVRRHKPWSRDEARGRALALMNRLQLAPETLKAYPFELSGGMAQRMGIMAALLLQPQLLLADEPTSALDTVTQAAVVRELRDLCREQGTALLLVTHHMGVAWYLADQIMVMQQGDCVEQGSREAVFERPHAAYTRALIAAVPQAEPLEEGA
jgi:ABC-type glutathione transport system ATPase component